MIIQALACVWEYPTVAVINGKSQVPFLYLIIKPGMVFSSAAFRNRDGISSLDGPVPVTIRM